VGEKKNQQSSSTVFKVGAISLAFLIIGYEAALFVTRASALRIVANRDKPDTVFVYLPADSMVRKDSEHTTAALRAYSNYRQEGSGYHKQPEHRSESFRFDPNTVSTDDLRRLGFSLKQAQSIDNYRKAGGRYSRAEDFARSFVVSDSVYERLKPYIDIPRLDINTADSAAFDALPGIGPYFASKMVKYRIELGGYSYVEQLMDIYNFGIERFSGIEDLVWCSESLSPFGLWTLGADSLRLHPYIRSYQVARAIVLFRENTPRADWSVSALVDAGILSDEDGKRLARCALLETVD